MRMLEPGSELNFLQETVCVVSGSPVGLHDLDGNGSAMSPVYCAIHY
jgi:hypothetical protein